VETEPHNSRRERAWERMGPTIAGERESLGEDEQIQEEHLHLMQLSCT